MKTTTALAIAALALTGAACSQDASAPSAPEVTAQTVSADVQATPSAPADSGFNLRVPGDDGASTGGDSGFNLRMPDEAPQTGGFKMPDTVISGDALSDLPEIGAPMVDAPAVPAPDTDDEPLIRLD